MNIRWIDRMTLLEVLDLLMDTPQIIGEHGLPISPGRLMPDYFVCMNHTYQRLVNEFEITDLNGCVRIHGVPVELLAKMEQLQPFMVDRARAGLTRCVFIEG